MFYLNDGNKMGGGFVETLSEQKPCTRRFGINPHNGLYQECAGHGTYQLFSHSCRCQEGWTLGSDGLCTACEAPFGPPPEKTIHGNFIFQEDYCSRKTFALNLMRSTATYNATYPQDYKECADHGHAIGTCQGSSTPCVDNDDCDSGSTCVLTSCVCHLDDTRGYWEASTLCKDCLFQFYSLPTNPFPSPKIKQIFQFQCLYGKNNDLVGDDAIRAAVRV